MNILRRLALSRLLLLCGTVIAIGIGATALASALSSGPTPEQKRLPVAIHDALAGPAVEGVSASVQLTDHLLEGANIASGSGEASQLASSPLLSGASGRMWVAKDGRVRLELQAEKGDTEILYDGHTVELYDASNNTLYRYTIPSQAGSTASSGSGDHHEAPSLSKIEEAISNLQKHSQVSEAQPGDVAGQPAYTVRVSPKEGGSLFGGVELAFDAVHGIPLRAAVYSSSSSSPVLELVANEISYQAIESSVFDFTPPPEATIHEVKAQEGSATQAARASRSHHARSARSHKRAGGQTKLITRGKGLSTVAVLERKATTKGGGGSSASLPESLPKVKINGVSATELATPLGTLLSFERSGVRYLLAGSVAPSALEAVARGL